MTETLATTILEACDAAWAFLDNKQRIVQFNPQFQEWHNHPQSLNLHPVTDAVPETVGLEPIFQELISGKRTTFLLPQIERETYSKETLYLNLILVATQIPDKPILLLLFNDTERALNHQQIQQQSYEIKLMRSLINTKTALTFSVIGNSAPINQLKNMIQKIASVRSSSVLIEGETGTGKSMVAQLIHLSSDAEQPFVEFNCAAVPESLLESELFGHEKGAFTHAVTQKKGLMEEADGGTLFLDEIGDIPLSLQSKLLTALESRKFRRLGSTQKISASFRLIAATNQDLQAMMKEGTFREDLYYRIQVVTLRCPSLRELGNDIIQIAKHFIQIYNREFGKTVTDLTPDAQLKLKTYSWPGNVRELRNVTERAMIFTEKSHLDSNDIQLHQTQNEQPVADLFTLPENGFSFEELEKRMLKEALERSNGNQSQAARLLKMSRDTFRYRLEKHNMLT